MTFRPLSFLRRFRKDDTGNATIEFALAVPLVFFFFFSSVELGMRQIYQMWLDRGLDMTVRLVRLNTGANYTHEDLKGMICEFSGNLADCNETLRLEMKPLAQRSFGPLPTEADCVDVSQPVTPLRQFVHGASHQLMLLRTCYKYKPVFPTAGLGADFDKDGSGRVIMISETVFVQEPN
ncbi:MAG: pilus assembly protein [Rhodobacteraceae bacterium]|nr:pilus assembly protein [Paracoccaceae bacterium]